jgi:GntR family transcriptional regulator of vanillate catabolism
VGESKNSQTVTALLKLREMILSGALSPGERLTETAVAERLGVSRTPLRTALAQLEAEGLLNAVASGGYTVREFSVADIIDAIELRGVLEGLAARFAAEHGTPAVALAELRAVLATIDRLMSKRHDESAFRKYMTLNKAFHVGVQNLAGSDVLSRELARVTALPFAAPSAFVMAQSVAADAWDSLVVSHAQHHGILDAIEAREATRAEALMREHARRARASLHLVLGNDLSLSLIKGGVLLERAGQKLRRSRRDV